MTLHEGTIHHGEEVLAEGEHAVRKKGEMNAGVSAFSPFYSACDRSPEDDAVSVQGGSSLFKPVWESTHRHTLRYVSIGILSPVELMMKTNHYNIKFLWVENLKRAKASIFYSKHLYYTSR